MSNAQRNNGRLLITRRKGESVIIGDNVKVTVLGSSNGEIKIGITAPKTIPVHRKEVYHRIKHGKPGTDI